MYESATYKEREKEIERERERERERESDAARACIVAGPRHVKGHVEVEGGGGGGLGNADPCALRTRRDKELKASADAHLGQ